MANNFTSRASRGSTLIEVLIAGALLAIGMTAIATMLNESVSSSRLASKKTEASELGVSLSEQFVTRGYDSLTPGGPYDAGRFTDDAGVFLYDATYSVIDLNAGGGAIGYPTYRVEVTVHYDETPNQLLPGNRRQRFQTYSSVLTDVP